MEIIKTNKVFDFLKYGKLLFGLSAALFILSIVFFATKGLNYGIDFSGGTVVQVQYKGEAPIPVIREAVSKSPLFANAVVTKFGSESEVVIKTPTATSSVDEDMGDVATKLLAGTGDFEVRRVDMVGPKVGDELKEKGLTALGLALVAIMAYVAFRFEWRFALAAVIALFHDVLITVGFLSVTNTDVNLDTVAALLTILGYSINDTIIVFDRIREVVKENKLTSFKEIVNVAVSNTLARTILTSLTVFFVVLTLYLFGGEIMVGFSLPLLVGVIVGTYSSVFIASQIVIWLGFSVNDYRENEAKKEKRKKDKEKLRAMYEKGVV
jgi:preprotein translocase subunit SecF